MLPDDAWARAAVVAFDHRVEVILGLENVGHPPVGVEEADASDAPAAARGGNVVGVHGHVRAVEAADADVEDAGERERRS
jgi:hypothetical protein